MNITYAYTPHFTDTRLASRPIFGLVLHDTEGDSLVAPHAQGSWHYEIGRSGEVWQFIDDADVAWHVRDTDEWHPAWLPRTRPYGVSAANCHTIGIELVSSANFRDPGDDHIDGGPYSEAQYQALKELLALLYGRYGDVPIVSHGSLQLDRTDPVAFDYSRAGLVWLGDGYTFIREPEEPEVSPEDQAILDVMHDLGANASSIDGWINEIGALHAELLREQGEVDQLNGIANELQGQVDALREEVAALKATVQVSRRVVTGGGRVPIQYSDEQAGAIWITISEP